MVREFGLPTYAIVGHSSARSYHAESTSWSPTRHRRLWRTDLVRTSALRGETPAERKAGRLTEAVGRQLDAVIAPWNADVAKCVKLYGRLGH